MKLKRIIILHFRGIEEAYIDVSDYTAIIGKNGSCKSTILAAMSFFFTQNYRVTRDDFTERNTVDNVRVTMVFGGLSENVTSEFRKYVHNAEIAIEKKAVWNAEQGEAVCTYHGSCLSHVGFDHVRAVSGRPLHAAFRNLRKTGEYDDLADATNEPGMLAAMEAWEEAHPELCELRPDAGRFFGFTGVGKGKIDRWVRFHRIPAVLSVEEHASENSSDVLKSLVSMHVPGRSDPDRSFGEVERRAREIYHEVLGGDAFDLSGVSTALTRCIREFVEHASVEVSWDGGGEVRISQPKAIVLLGDSSFVCAPAYKGHGLLRAYEMGVIAFLSEQSTRAEGSDVDAEDGPALILGVDEPEIYQHPTQARVIANRLKRLGGSRVGRSSVQVLCTSHSPLFVTVEQSDSIRLVRRARSGGNGWNVEVSQITMDSIAERLAATTMPGITGGVLRGRLRTLFHPSVAEAFFADFVVVVEGIEDVAWIQGMLAYRSLDEAAMRRGIVVSPVAGKRNVDKMHAVLDALRIPHYCVIDTDSDRDDDGQGQREKEFNRRFAQLLSDSEYRGEGYRLTNQYCAFEPRLADAVKASVSSATWAEGLARAANAIGVASGLDGVKNPVGVEALLAYIGEREESGLACLDALIQRICMRTGLVV